MSPLHVPLKKDPLVLSTCAQNNACSIMPAPYAAQCGVLFIYLLILIVNSSQKVFLLLYSLSEVLFSRLPLSLFISVPQVTFITFIYQSFFPKQT